MNFQNATHGPLVGYGGSAGGTGSGGIRPYAMPQNEGNPRRTISGQDVLTGNGVGASPAASLMTPEADQLEEGAPEVFVDDAVQQEVEGKIYCLQEVEAR